MATITFLVIVPIAVISIFARTLTRKFMSLNPFQRRADFDRALQQSTVVTDVRERLRALGDRDPGVGLAVIRGTLSLDEAEQACKG